MSKWGSEVDKEIRRNMKECERQLRQKQVIDSLTPVWEQLENNQPFIQQKMQGKRRVY